MLFGWRFRSGRRDLPLALAVVAVGAYSPMVIVPRIPAA